MIRSLRLTVARLAIVSVLLVGPVALGGCGAGSHYLVNVLAHKVANHFAKTPAARRRVDRAFCIYSVYRAFHDLTHHHLIFGALNARQALINCEAGFRRHAR
jgi:hypothetical protein